MQLFGYYRLNKIKKVLVTNRRKLKLYFTKTCYLSLGENCLTDNILKRYGIKSFSTIYSNGRSNIEYAIHLEKESYQHLLNQKYLYFDYVNVKKVVRNNHYSKSLNIYHHLHQNGFEFTHHDVITDENAQESAKRKIIRLKKYRGKKNFKFFYHYRYNRHADLDMLIEKAKKFNALYNVNNKKSEIIVFTQKLVKKSEERKLEKYHIDKTIKVFILHTLDIWQGDDNNILWAKNDEDLLAEMLRSA